MPIVLEAVWDSGVTVSADNAWNEGRSPQHACHRADIKTWQVRVSGRVVDNGLVGTPLTPARCMILSGDSPMGANVLKYTRDTSL
jgi:hypothetical protein